MLLPRTSFSSVFLLISLIISPLAKKDYNFAPA